MDEKILLYFPNSMCLSKSFPFHQRFWEGWGTEGRKEGLCGWRSVRSPRVVFCTKIVLLERRLNFEDLRETNSLADCVRGDILSSKTSKRFQCWIKTEQICEEGAENARGLTERGPTVSASTHSNPAELRHQRSPFPSFLFKKGFECSAAFKPAFRPTWCDICKLKDSQTGSHLGRDDPKRFDQVRIMPFIQTCLAQIQSASLKTTTLYVYNMSIFPVVDRLLNRLERTSSVRYLQKQVSVF